MMDTPTPKYPILPTSNLVQPDRDTFLKYARFAHEGSPVVEELERRLARFHDVEHCIALCNGFWALVLALRLLALPSRTDVLMPSLTYRRMADVAAWAGLRPRFCEVDPATLACTSQTMRAALAPEIGILLAVHPIVGCCDVAGLTALAEDERLPLLFDSVESVFEHVPAGKVGRFGRAECFSLHASKLLNGFEGGYVTTQDKALANRLVDLRHEMQLTLEPLHAALTLANLDDLDSQVARNRARYDAYQSGLTNVTGLRLVQFAEDSPTSYKNILVELTEDWPLSRDETVCRLNSCGMLARAYYHPPLHAKTLAYPHVTASLPDTDRLSTRYVLLPCGHHVGLADVRSVVDTLAALAA